MRWQKPSIQRWNCARGWETRRIPPELDAKVSSKLTKEGSRLRAGTCACDEGLSDGPVEPGVARSKSDGNLRVLTNTGCALRWTICHSTHPRQAEASRGSRFS